MCLAVGTFTPRELRDDPPPPFREQHVLEEIEQSRGINLEDYEQQTQPRSNPCSCKHVRLANLTEVYRCIRRVRDEILELERNMWRVAGPIGRKSKSGFGRSTGMAIEKSTR